MEVHTIRHTFHNPRARALAKKADALVAKAYREARSLMKLALHLEYPDEFPAPKAKKKGKARRSRR